MKAVLHALEETTAAEFKTGEGYVLAAVCRYAVPQHRTVMTEIVP